MENTAGENNPWKYLSGSNAYIEQNIEPNIEPDFENMDDFEKKPKHPSPIKRQYSTLYDELLAKCDFENFRGDEELAIIANRLYAQLRKLNKNSPELISIRNEAIRELGITISTEEKYNYLTKYCNPSLFRNPYPYNEEMANRALRFESRIKQNADNIIELERIEKDAKDFIQVTNYILVKGRIGEYIQKKDWAMLSYYVLNTVLKDEMIKREHIREIFDRLIYRVDYNTAIKMLKEAFMYDPTEKEYYTGKMLMKNISIDPDVAITALINTILTDPNNEQYYNRVIKKVEKKQIAGKGTTWTIILLILGIIIFVTLSFLVFPH